MKKKKREIMPVKTVGIYTPSSAPQVTFRQATHL